MTMTTHIRFLDPIDPREVWEMAKVLVNAPKDFEVKYKAANTPWWEGCKHVDLNAEIRAMPDQGADALIWLEYGPEGSLLRSDWDDEDGEDDRPPAYVELFLDTPYSCSQGSHRKEIAATINWAAKRGVRALWWQGECCPEWHHLVTPELENA